MCFLFQKNTPEPEYYTKLKSITSHFQRILECPVCFQVLKYPFKWCTNGHGVCTKCAEALEACPTCQALFTSSKNATLPLCFKSVLEALPQFCCYSDAGCGEIVEQNDDHERFCGFRPSYCFVEKCPITVPISKQMPHMKESHGVGESVLQVENTWVKKEWGNFNSKIGKVKVYGIYIANNWSWLKLSSNVKAQGLIIDFYSAFVGQPVDNYFLTVKFENGNFVYSTTLRAYELGSPSIDVLDDDGNISSVDSNKDLSFEFFLPFGLLENLIDQYSDLYYSFKIFTMPKNKLTT